MKLERLEVCLSEDAAEKLRRLMRLCEAKSAVQVIANALAVYDTLMREAADRDGVACVRYPNGDIKMVELQK